MRRPTLSLLAAIGSVWAWTTPGVADDFNPFAEQTSLQEAVAPFTPAPEDIPLAEPPAQPMETAPEAPGEPMHEEEHFEYYEPHYHNAHEEHEEPLGNIRVTPLYREIESSVWRRIFDNMYSVNVGTTFWQPERYHGNYSTQVGLVTEFQYSALDAKSGVNISSVISNPFNIRENLRVNDADIFAGNIGLSFVANTYLPDSCTKLELGFSPILMIGNLSANLVANTPTAGQTNIVLDRGATNDGTIVGGDFRLWTGIKTQSGFRAGITGFYGIAETDAIYDVSEQFRTYGGGFYVELPTRFVPHEFPAPFGTFQWIDELLHLE